jgi:type III secretion protein Q
MPSLPTRPAPSEPRSPAPLRDLSRPFSAPISIAGRAVPARALPRAAVARLGLELTALPGTAALEVEPALVVALVDRLAGGPGETCGATSLTGVVATARAIFALAALDGACWVAACEETLAPRLCRAAPEPVAPLAVELTVTAGALSGRARLLVPAAAVRALAGAPSFDGAASGIGLVVSVRGGAAALAPESSRRSRRATSWCSTELQSRAPRAPGGARLAGRLEDEAFHVEEVEMTQRIAQLPVVLEVELARVEMTLAELARLEPGATLPLALDRRGVVTLRAGERAIARGELIDVDGSVGVRIASLEVAP